MGALFHAATSRAAPCAAKSQPPVRTKEDIVVAVFDNLGDEALAIRRAEGAAGRRGHRAFDVATETWAQAGGRRRLSRLFDESCELLGTGLAGQ